MDLENYTNSGSNSDSLLIYCMLLFVSFKRVLPVLTEGALDSGGCLGSELVLFSPAGPPGLEPLLALQARAVAARGSVTPGTNQWSSAASPSTLTPPSLLPSFRNSGPRTQEKKQNRSEIIVRVSRLRTFTRACF